MLVSFLQSYWTLIIYSINIMLRINMQQLAHDKP